MGSTPPPVGGRPTQTVGGFEFPVGPGPARRNFSSEAAKWREVALALRCIRDCLDRSDRSFYRDLIGLESMALANLRDRQSGGVLQLQEEPSTLLDGFSGH